MILHGMPPHPDTITAAQAWSALGEDERYIPTRPDRAADGRALFVLNTRGLLETAAKRNREVAAERARLATERLRSCADQNKDPAEAGPLPRLPAEADEP